MRAREAIRHVHSLHARASYSLYDCTEYAYLLCSQALPSFDWESRKADLHLYGAQLGSTLNVGAVVELGAGSRAEDLTAHPGAYYVQRWWSTGSGPRGHCEIWLVDRLGVWRLHSTPGKGPTVEPGDWQAKVAGSNVSWAAARLRRGKVE